jgi:hypothetical protein
MFQKNNIYLDKNLKVYYVYLNYKKWIGYKNTDLYNYEPEKYYILRDVDKEYNICIRPRLSKLMESIEKDNTKEKTFSVWAIFFDQFKNENQRYVNNN